MLRFGVTGLALDPGRPDGGRIWTDRVRGFEEAGFDVFWVPDHVGLVDPFTGLVAAACATERLRVGTYVLNVEFWNPLLLARTVATAALVTGGRLVVGLGAGHNRAEFEQAGLRYPSAGERIDRLAATLAVLPRLLAGETVDDERLGLAGAATGLPPVRVPLLVGGNGDRVLGLAGRHADMVGLTGFTAGTGRTHNDLSHWGWDGLVDRLGHARAAAADVGRPLVADVLVQRVAVTDDPRAALADVIDDGLDDHQLDSPFLLVGDMDSILSRLQRLESVGIDGISAFAHDAESLAAVIARYRAGGVRAAGR